jgi:general secretion pathway protein A
MYKHFFGLRENPFNVNPDPRYLFLTPQTQEALDELTYGIQARKGLILLTGEVGTGKTTLINRLLDWLREQRTPAAFIFNSHLEISHLFDFILADFGVPFDARLKGNAVMRLNQWLFERYRAGETPVMIVDEAQGLPDRVLEEIRMLLNLETPSEKLLQIVLVGQPELEARLRRPELRQVKQRITLRCKTAALTLNETHDYIQARLHIAGANGKPVFASQAMDAVHFYSRGIPRVINLLCEHALINAYVDHVQPVPVHIIGEVAREFQFDDIKPMPPFRDSRDTPDSDLIARQSRFKSGQASPPATADRPGKKQPVASTTPFLAPFAVAETVLSHVKESAKPVLVLEPEQIPDPKEDAAATKPWGARVSALAGPSPRRIGTCQPSELTEFPSEVVTQFSAGLKMKLAPLALPPLPRVAEAKGRFELLPGSHCWQVSSPQEPLQPLNVVEATKSGALRSSPMKIIALPIFLVRWSTRWRDRSSSPGTSPAGARRTAIVRHWQKRSLQPLHRWNRLWLAWKDGCLTAVGSIDWRRGKASVYRWLRQPSNPTQWRFPEWRLFDGCRNFNYKKM